VRARGVQGLGGLPVQRDPHGARDGLVQRAPHERVPEREPLPGLADHARRGRLLDGGQQFGGLLAHHRGEVAEVELDAEQRGPPQRVPRRVVEVVEPPGHHRVHRRLRRVPGAVVRDVRDAVEHGHGVVAHEGVDDLLQVAGVAARAVGRGQQFGAGLGAEQPADQFGRDGVGHRVEPQQFAAAHRHHRPQRVQLGPPRVRPARAHQQQREVPARLREPVPHQQAGVVGPLEVFEHQHDRAVRAQLVDEADDPVDQADQPVDRHQHGVVGLPRVRGLGRAARQPGRELGPARVRRQRVDVEAGQDHAQREAPVHLVARVPQHLAAPVDRVGQTGREQGGLADTRLALDPHRRAPARQHLLERGAQRGQFRFAADEHRRVRRDRRPRCDGRLAAHPFTGRGDLVVDLAQLRARLDAELLDQDLPGLPEHLQRLVPAPRAVQRQHQQRPRRLAQRVGGAQVEQLVHGGPEVAGLQHDLGPALQDVEVQLGEPAPVQRGERAVDAGERVAAPQQERGVQRLLRARGVPAVPALLRRLPQPVELADVQQPRFQPQAVPGTRRHEHLPARPLGTDGFERAPQPGDVGVEAAVDGAGR
jgi:hypothetical protein